MSRKVITVVSALIVNAGGEILMGLRPANKLRGGLWETPGGTVEPIRDRSNHDALIRECFEELGCKVTIQAHTAIATALLEIDDGGPWADREDVNLFVHLYPVMLWDEPRALDHVALRWIAPDHAMRYLPCSPAFYEHYRAIRRYIALHLLEVS
jgi:8-oxo-dGTP pyrophosphatase MutT (NUDIX family)